MLLYTSRGASGTSRFRTRGLLPLRGMLVSASSRGLVPPAWPGGAAPPKPQHLQEPALLWGRHSSPGEEAQALLCGLGFYFLGFLLPCL